jgi:hypothetical protein
MPRIDPRPPDRERDVGRELRRRWLDLGRLVRIRIALPFALLCRGRRIAAAIDDIDEEYSDD